MRKLLFSTLLIAIHCSVNGQIISGGNFNKYIEKHKPGGARAFTVNSNCITSPEVGKSYNVKMSTVTIPAAFNRIELKNSVYSLGSPLNIGAGYTWIRGKVIYQQDGSVEVSPGFFYGLGFDTGLKPDSNSLHGSFCGNLFIGFNKVAINVGYDIVNGNIFFGLGTKIDIFRFAGNDIYTVNCVWENPRPH